MIVKTTHTTTYLYSEPVSICHTGVHLTPRECPHQRLLSYHLSIVPEPTFTSSRLDYFGNQITIFSIEEPHQTLTIQARSEIELRPEDPPAEALTPPWEVVRDHVGARNNEETFRACEFAFPSP